MKLLYTLYKSHKMSLTNNNKYSTIMKIRLTRRGLNRVISESVRKLINELDISTMPIFNDARDRDAWWKQQALNDFPDERRRINDTKFNFKDLYDDLRNEKAQREKDNAKLEKQRQRDDARKAREGARKAKEDERMNAKRKKRSLFLNVVNYVIGGDELLMSMEQSMDLGSDIPEDWSDGVEKIPVVLRRGGKKWARIHSIGKGLDKENAFLSLGWGMSVKGVDKEDGEIYMKFSVYVHPHKNKIYFEVDDVDSDLLNNYLTGVYTSKYLNSVIRRKYKEALEKMERYGTSDIAD